MLAQIDIPYVKQPLKSGHLSNPYIHDVHIRGVPL